MILIILNNTLQNIESFLLLKGVGEVLIHIYKLKLELHFKGILIKAAQIYI